LIRIKYKISIKALIESFKCKETKRIWNGRRSSNLPGNIQNKALRKLRQLDAANILADLQNPPGNKLEILKGDRKGQYSMRIDRQWRICFIWEKGNASNVEIVDYHS
jgi:toxin HigB-1